MKKLIFVAIFVLLFTQALTPLFTEADVEYWPAQKVKKVDTSPKPLKASRKAVVLSETQIANKAFISLEFKAYPQMISIVGCESGFNQFDPDYPGKFIPYMGKRSPDVGIMQINKIHWERAESLGLDIFNSTQDNIKMGQIILKEQGLTAWVCYKG